MCFIAARHGADVLLVPSHAQLVRPAAPQNFATGFFYYCHHTFTHLNLDNETVHDAMLLQLYQLMAGPVRGKPEFDVA